MLQPFLVLALALSGALTVGVVATQLNIAVSRTPSAALLGYAAQTTPSAFEQVGEALLRRFPGIRSWLDIEGHRAWLALEGPAPSLAAVVGQAAVLALGGLILAALTVPAVAVMGLIGLVYPFARLRSRANAVRRRVQRSLPDLSALMAAEMAAGNPPDKAIERASEFGGALARLVSIAIEESRSRGRPLFGRGNMAGLLVEVVGRYDLPAVRAFASQLDQAARTGAASPRLMQGLARTLIIEYKERALREAEGLDSRLAVPSVLFFFMPFMFLILVPLIQPVMKVL